MGRAAPCAVGGCLSIDSNDDELAAETLGQLAEESRAGEGGAVDADFVGSGSKQAFGVVHRADATAHGEGDVDGSGDAFDELGEGMSPFVGGADVEIDKLVGTFSGIPAAELDGIADVAQTDEVNALTVRPSLTSRQGMIRFESIFFLTLYYYFKFLKFFRVPLRGRNYIKI